MVAGKLAEILKGRKLVLLTNTPGVLDKAGNLLTGLTPRDIDDLVADGTLSGGMLPKIARPRRRPQRGEERASSTAGSSTACSSRSSPTTVSAR